MLMLGSPLGADIEAWLASLPSKVADGGLVLGKRLLGAIVVWYIGSWIVNRLAMLGERAMERRHIDHTIRRYITSLLASLLKVALAFGVLEILGVQTATFAALLAGAGLAIGTAWGDMLKNFAAGVFMLALRPFKVGEFVTAGGITGTVQEIGIFVTVINTPDNIRTVVGNNRIFSDTIQNFTANPFRRVELTAQLAHTVDPNQAIRLLRERLPKIPNVIKDPAPDVFIVTFNDMGPVLCVRPYCHNDHYWQVYFDTNAAIQDEFSRAGLPAAMRVMHIQQR